MAEPKEGLTRQTHPMTAARIREAADTLRVVYLPLLKDMEDDRYAAADLSERLADLLDVQADAVQALEAAGYEDGADGQALVVAELAVLVCAIEGAT